MGQVTWLGSDDPDLKELSGFGLVFVKGETVKVDDDTLLLKLSGNRYFKVEGFKPKPPETEPLVYRSAVEMSAQHPVAKPGEPVAPEDMARPQPVPAPKPVEEKAEEAEEHHPAVKAAMQAPAAKRKT